MTRYTYPHTIESGSGEYLTFLRRVPGTNGDRLEVENVVKPGVGPPMHAHTYQTEALTVEEGRIAWVCPGEEPRFAGPGETVSFAPGVAHRFWNPGDVDLRCTGYIEPADNVEYFLAQIFDSTKRNGGERPDIFEAAFLTTRYRSEFSMLAVPAPVQRFVFPVLVMVGRMLGRFDRYADAPEPIRR